MKLLDRSNLVILKESAIASIKAYLENLLINGKYKRLQHLSYWLIDYIKLLSKEEIFDTSRFIRYKRGDVVFVDFGFRIGSELGGKHFATIIDVSNAKTQNTLTVVPLSSYKGSKLHNSQINIGEDLLEKVNLKISAIEQRFNGKNKSIDTENKGKTYSDINALFKLLELRGSMKKGSIALCSQITTISKLRIIQPIYRSNSLYGVRLSNESLDLINDKIKELYTK